MDLYLRKVEVFFVVFVFGSNVLLAFIIRFVYFSVLEMGFFGFEFLKIKFYG